MDEDQQKAFEHVPEMNLAISEPGVGRFRSTFLSSVTVLH